MSSSSATTAATATATAKASEPLRQNPPNHKTNKDGTALQAGTGYNSHRNGHVDEGNQTTYISPSDNIMSPTTKKLSAIKGKRFGSGKPQSLFAKTVGKQAHATSHVVLRSSEDDDNNTINNNSSSGGGPGEKQQTELNGTSRDVENTAV